MISGLRGASWVPPSVWRQIPRVSWRILLEGEPEVPSVACPSVLMV